MRLAVLAVAGLTASSAFAQPWSGPLSKEAGVGIVAGLVVASTVGSTYASVQASHRRSVDDRCHHDRDCADTYRCDGARQCVRRDHAATRQRDEAAQAFVAEHAVALREELALGRGPVLTAIGGEGAGRKLKPHRAELLALIGDGSDPGWPARFLARADALTTGGPACLASR